MALPHEFVLHQQPVWRDRSNFIINAELSEDDQPKRFEQLFVHPLDNVRFEICFIQFFLYDIALGDVVITTSKGGREYVFDRVVEQSGRYVFRVWFGDSSQPRDEISDAITRLGSLVEWSSRNLLAVDAVDVEHAQHVADFLAKHEEAGHLIYETGRSGLAGSVPRS